MNTYFLNSNIIDIGNNKIIITKKYNFSNPVFYLNINNVKTIIDAIKISDTSFELKIPLYKKSNVMIYIKDGIIEESLSLYFIKDENYEPIKFDDYNITITYIKDVLNVSIKKRNNFKKDTTLVFEGDINKTIFWNGDNKEITINFPYQIKGFTVLNFKLNNNIKKSTVYNLDDFPKNLIKIKGGVKLNKKCDFDLKLKSNTNEWVIKKGENSIFIELDDAENLKLFINDFQIFEQHITKQNFLPYLTILENPLRIKISQPYYEDISIKFKNKSKRWIIPQGETEHILKFDKNIIKLELEEVNNAIWDKGTMIYHIK